MTDQYLTVPRGWNTRVRIHNELLRLSCGLDEATKAVATLMQFIDQIPEERFAELWERRE